MNRQSRFVVSILAFGYAFLYVPLLLVVVYSFNDSRIATVWGGFSTRWYGELLRNEQILDAALLSLRIAFTSATIATVLGTMAGLALARFRRFKGRTLFSGMITSPMVMPEVITGLSLLLLFVALQQLTGWPGQRGFGTITIAHTTFAMAYVAVIVQSRLMAMDESLEEAALREMEEDIRLAKARKALDWDEQIRLSIDPERSKRIRDASPPEDADVCTMCGTLCAIKIGGN